MGDAVQKLIEEYTLVATGAKPSMYSLQLARLQHKANLETIEKLRAQLDRALAREVEQDEELAGLRSRVAANTDNEADMLETIARLGSEIGDLKFSLETQSLALAVLSGGSR